MATVGHPTPPPTLQGRVAIVTGSSRGIGLAIALHLASLGAKVVVNYTANSAQAEAVAAEINASSAPGSAIVVRADVSEPSHVKLLFDAAEEAFGSPVHIMVNSAAIADPTYSSLADISVEDFDRIFSVNTRGAFLCCKEAANRLKRGGGGRVYQDSVVFVVSLISSDFAQGGKWEWGNLVTACSKCNSRKGSKTLEEADMKLIKVPKAPKDYDILAVPLTSAAIKMLRMSKGTPEEWRRYLSRPSPES